MFTNSILMFEGYTGCPQKKETKTGEDITSKLGQPQP